MFRAFSLFVTLLVLGFLVSACATHPRQVEEAPQIFDIKAVSVSANADISAVIIRNVKISLDKAAAATARPIPLPAVTMNVHIVSISSGIGIDGARSQAEVSVVLADLADNHPIEVKNFLIYSFSIDTRTADAALAEAIASRLRFEYALMMPQIRSVFHPNISTRMRSDDPNYNPNVNRSNTDEKPMVIPLKTAPIIGADQDPLLNSKTKTEPQIAVDPVPNAKMKPADSKPAENAFEAGAKTKVVITPKKVAPASDEPCVETLDKKCSAQ
jgi:hypothetical protein